MASKKKASKGKAKVAKVKERALNPGRSGYKVRLALWRAETQLEAMQARCPQLTPKHKQQLESTRKQLLAAQANVERIADSYSAAA